ncbi:super-infection exclusion protein B [Vibrio metschnikovii]|uniref:super-infection exclusion protein B n=1 Tax=Vibrio metschnikovii TaxID=28172 RepID=UPI001C30D4A1|nr:super-infection exclusion protein B [Vibrio metschnikovii]
MTDFLSRILGFIKRSPLNYSISTLLVVACIYFLPSSFLVGTRLGEFISEYNNYLLIVLILSVIVCSAEIIERINKYFKKRREESKRLKVLCLLNKQEKLIIKQYINNDSATLYRSYSDGVIGGLCKKNILFRASDMADPFGNFAFNIEPWVLKYYEEHPHLSESL